MTKNYLALPRVDIKIDAGSPQGSFEWWRHSVGQGGVNSQPLTPRVIEGMRKLKPRLVRIFLQEYFNVYPAHGVFDWRKLDAYMDSFDDPRRGPMIPLHKGIECVKILGPESWKVVE